MSTSLTTKPTPKGAHLLSGTATQSSQHGSGSAGKAVDGNTNQQYRGNSCTHTKNKSPWWKLSLGQEMSIDRVEVWNRADCCGNRLRGVQVKVGSQLCGSLTASTAKQTMRCNAMMGVVVELKMPRNDYLSLCEVKVYGTKPTPKGAHLLSGMATNESLNLYPVNLARNSIINLLSRADHSCSPPNGIFC